MLASAAMFWYVAWRRPDSRGFLVLVAGFFTTMLIREMDAWLDAIAKGFWVYPAAAVVFGTIVYALKNRPTLFKPMARHLDTKPFILITIGLVIVIVFSRMFGSGSLWLVVMGEAFNPVYKTVIQEGCELMGYAIITYGTVLNTFGKESIAT